VASIATQKLGEVHATEVRSLPSGSIDGRAQPSDANQISLAENSNPAWRIGSLSPRATLWPRNCPDWKLSDCLTGGVRNVLPYLAGCSL
jgi:hypothetical protein